ncbi:hypothetical protein [Amphiplicatus metriothermophilus]|uniref:Lipoprotein n=1 Tax=Amphiplicatus metriothermophilus TaxID=1519374 RepID=A0A239PMF1_9PROT|nr:hypothetical protein [Amphiplicatus metriothermophilus]MBB5517381.1 hypothetical protein [Amphiplicatus metriothermophilus]SNT68284.1 hypothetical protein SAMN06297382_0785 [Amphiplicatus metriothermophilus]
MRSAGALAALFLAACASGGAPDAPGPDLNAASGGADARIRDGMARLGASPARGECFAARIAGALDGEDEEEAARIVEDAADRRAMRAGVLAAPGPVRRAFIGANFGCSLAQ